MSNLRVALIRPPLIGHMHRGTGVYAENVLKSLQKAEGIAIEFVQHGEPLDRFDLVHYPYFDPFFLTLPAVKRKPTVVTVHDLIPLRFPDKFPAGAYGRIKWFIQKKSLQGAAAVITDSIASKKDIVGYAGIREGKVHVIYLGVGKEFRIIGSKKTLDQVKTKLKLPETFILCVGDVNYNKNISGLIAAFSHIHKKHNGMHLVLVGQGFVTPSPELGAIERLIASFQLESSIVCIGRIDLDDLVALYNMALVYIQPSFAEGFGLPVLEAFACGCPVISSKESSLPEIVGESGILIDPNNTESIVEAAEKFILNAKHRVIYQKKGLERAKQFTWETCADKTLKIYKTICGRQS